MDIRIERIGSGRRWSKSLNEMAELSERYCCGPGHRHIYWLDNDRYRGPYRAKAVACLTCAEEKKTEQVICFIERGFANKW